MKPMKPMLLKTTHHLPTEKNWLYEVKYDGFRALLHWTKNACTLQSRNGNDITASFPEVIQFCSRLARQAAPCLPLILDGELVHLLSPWHARFSAIQKRSFMENKQSIANHALVAPTTFLAFDLLKAEGQHLTDVPYKDRKKHLLTIGQKLNIPLKPTVPSNAKLQFIPSYVNGTSLWKDVVLHHGEGIVAKGRTTNWISGKRTGNWLKKKNDRYITTFLTSFNQENGYFYFAAYHGKDIVEIATIDSIPSKERATLIAFIKQNSTTKNEKRLYIPPAICCDIACIDFDGKHLREPSFHQFRFDVQPEQCTFTSLRDQLYPLPPCLNITHPEKPLWAKQSYTKKDYLFYLQEMAPELLPFLKNRPLTLLRFPHGVRQKENNESFYQKNCPSYAPDFIQTTSISSINYILCNNVETLIWIGNQLALELHIPYQPFPYTKPSEIVFDLDPPSVADFPLAIEAAQMMHALFAEFDLTSFVKTSGGKGLQLYIPLPDDTFTYEQTRAFCQAVCTLLSNEYPEKFTTKRHKKARGERLYLDYLQHDRKKTIISPFSPRGNDGGWIATPLYWDELQGDIYPTQFSMEAVLQRYRSGIRPFTNFFTAKETQPFSKVLQKMSIYETD